jgi:hypothetical protein
MIALVSPFVLAAQSRKQSVQVGSANGLRSEALLERAPEINRKSGPGRGIETFSVAV